jgi:hypothetical protein
MSDNSIDSPTDDRRLIYLVNHIVSSINLQDFMENELQIDFKWCRKDHSSMKCHCPMPNHNDNNASFHMKKTEEGAWIFHCFGCGSKGNIVHFFMDYYNLRNKIEAIKLICQKFNIKDKEDLILQGLKNINKRVDVQRTVENSNVLVSNQCRMLLRKDYKKYNTWVSKAFKQLNEALDKEDYDTIEQIGYEASMKISE